jgi:spermidine synthase
MEITRPELYQHWWHSASNEIGLANALALQTVKTLTTPAHKVELYSHSLLGWVLIVDDRLYSIESDDGYREMLIHVPLLGRRRTTCPVLLLGGEGAILREVLRHDFVTEVVVCESDPAMLEIGQEFLGFSAVFSDPRVTHYSLTAAEALATFATSGNGFDLIVCADASTTLSPHAIAACLTHTGVGVDCDWLVLGQERTGWLRDRQRQENNRLSVAATSTAFHSIQHYYSVSPWMTGYRGFFLSTNDAHSYAEPCFDYTGNHYNAAVHQAAFALPTCWPQVTPQSGDAS